MPVNTKLSRKAHDQLGEDVALELEDVVKRMDENHRADLREMSDFSFSRFDARLEQRLAEQGGSLRTVIAEQGASIRNEMAEMGASIRGEMSEMRVGLSKDIAQLGEKVAASEVRNREAILAQTRWMVGLWAAQITILIGAVLVVLRDR